MPERKQNLPQLYRFCFLMLGDSRKAQEVFHATLREAAVRAARGELPSEPFWLFRDARWRCLEATKSDLQPEAVEMEPYAKSSLVHCLSIARRRVKCAKFFGDHLACRNENKICHSFIAFVS